MDFKPYDRLELGMRGDGSFRSRGHRSNDYKGRKTSHHRERKEDGDFQGPCHLVIAVRWRHPEWTAFQVERRISMPEQLVIAVRWRHPEWGRISGGAKDLHARAVGDRRSLASS